MAAARLTCPCQSSRELAPSWRVGWRSWVCSPLEDLIGYYPRDYVDYSRLVRIQALVPGETATVVATVRRVHAFASPKNPNLAILELQLQDPSGRLRISKFMAGKRFTSSGWLHQQQRLYPPGATIAASGLVKENRFGISLHDPLLEVLEGPASTCLLYTSPSPRDYAASRMPSSA